MTGKIQTVKWTAACTLFVVLTITGCATQRQLLPSATSSNPAGSSSYDPQSPRPVDTTRPTLTPTELVSLELGETDPSPQPSPSPNPTPTATLTPTPVPTATPIPSPTPTPTPTLRQLTQGDCCTQPFWSPDSQQVLFIDKPQPDLPVGIWAVPITQDQPTPELVTDRIAFYTADFRFRIELSQDTTTIERVDALLASTSTLSETKPIPGTNWEVPAGGRSISISPGHKRIAWQVSNDDLPFERRVTQVWVANLDGSEPRSVATAPRGGFSGWISDDVLLLSSRESLESEEQVLYSLSLIDDRTQELAQGRRLRGGLLSPDGTWLAYFITLDEDPALNGIWLVRTDGSVRHQLERELFGPYQWRDDNRLVIIPFQPEATNHAIWEFNVNTGQTRHLTDPAVTPFKIANGDWAVSPDGQHVAFVESRDRNIWLLTLPD
jgi:Tol biopolymer transport system component